MTTNPSSAPETPNAGNIDSQSLYDLTTPEKYGISFKQRIMNTVSATAIGALGAAGTTAAVAATPVLAAGAVTVGTAAAVGGVAGLAVGAVNERGKARGERVVSTRREIVAGTNGLTPEMRRELIEKYTS